MINESGTMLNLERWFGDNYDFWFRNKQGDSCAGDEKESFRRALEWDLIEMYKFNNLVLHEYGKPNGEELDRETCLKFFKIKCQDLYGKNWEEHWNSYGLEREG